MSVPYGSLASENHQGEMVDWALSELSLKPNVTPVYVDETSRFGTLESRLEIVDAPMFPGDRLETFLEALIAGFTGPALDEAVNGMFQFGDIDILGLSVSSVNFVGMPNQTGHLYMGLNLAHR